jgi:hypothetical protein
MFITFQNPFPALSVSQSTHNMDPHDTTIHEEQRQLREMLGDYTAAELRQLPAKREKVYHDHLLREDAIIGMQDVGPGFTYMPNGTMLLQEYYMGYDDIGKQLVKEARESFYRANMFSVPSHSAQAVGLKFSTSGSLFKKPRARYLTMEGHLGILHQSTYSPVNEGAPLMYGDLGSS